MSSPKPDLHDLAARFARKASSDAIAPGSKLPTETMMGWVEGARVASHQPGELNRRA